MAASIRGEKSESDMLVVTDVGRGSSSKDASFIGKRCSILSPSRDGRVFSSAAPFHRHLPGGPWLRVRRGTGRRSAGRAPRMGEHAPHSRWQTREGRVMEGHSLFVETRQFIAPIGCRECDGEANGIRGGPYQFEGLEFRTFECSECGYQLERVTPSHAP